MNPLTNVRNIQKLGEQELRRGSKSSWHDQYRDSAWSFVGGLPYDLTEGDIITIFSQYGEVVNINLIRDKDTGKQKGYGLLCYEDQRSTVLAVDNFNGTKEGQYELIMLQIIKHQKIQKILTKKPNN
ncbi:RNA-binding motif protein, X-linked 2-like isoform X2 [Halictus rubicundus]|uniref:RNA-binding motif protein, X-linked 2-like isoform X2 n=1 Tax=Halictus rubicundus TaxID=77578 RepID=UPI00403562A1